MVISNVFEWHRIFLKLHSQQTRTIKENQLRNLIFSCLNNEYYFIFSIHFLLHIKDKSEKSTKKTPIEIPRCFQHLKSNDKCGNIYSIMPLFDGETTKIRVNLLEMHITSNFLHTLLNFALMLSLISSCKINSLFDEKMKEDNHKKDILHVFTALE